LFGYNTGSSFTGNNIGSNNIIIGTNISLPNGTSNALYIGGIIFGTGAYGNTSGDPSITPTNGKIGIGVVNPTAGFQVSNNISASSGLATGVLFNNTLTPSANFNTLVGLDVNPIFDHSIFGTTTDIGIRNRGTLRLVAASNPNNYGDLSYSTDAFIQTDSNTNIKSGGGKYYGVSSGSYYQVGQYGDAIITNGWSNFSVSGLSYDQPSIARSHPSSPYNQNLLSFTGTVNSGSGAANNSLLNGLYTKLTDNSSNTVINILNGVYSDVSAGTNTSAIRNSGIFIGGNFGINTTAPQYTLDVGTVIF
jgi:hypothetical protein